MLNYEAKNCFRKIVKFHNKDEMQSLDEFTQLITCQAKQNENHCFVNFFNTRDFFNTFMLVYLALDSFDRIAIFHSVHNFILNGHLNAVSVGC